MASNLITTVITPATATAPAGAYDLTTLDVVKAELAVSGTASDVILQRYISGASAAAGGYCNRVFVVETVKDELWLQRDRGPGLMCGGMDVLQLTRYPVIASPVPVVIEDGVTLTVTSDYRVDADKGQIIRLNDCGNPRSWHGRALSAQYAAGFAVIPDDVADAVVRMVKQRWFAKGQDTSIKQENIPGVREFTRWVAAGSEAGNMPPDVVDILDNYRVPVTA